MHNYQNHEGEDTNKPAASPSRQEEIKTNSDKLERTKKKIPWRSTDFGTNTFHLLCLLLLSLLLWGLLWCAFGDSWRWGGDWFLLAAMAGAAWCSARALEALGLPSTLAPLLLGIAARNTDVLDMRHYAHVDSFLRKIYPVIILGKTSLGWNIPFMKQNWLQVSALGGLPWLSEVVTFAICTNVLLGFPWIRGFLSGSVFASLSWPVVVPTVKRISDDSRKKDLPLLLGSAARVDLALSVELYGVIFNYITFDGDYGYKYAKAALTPFVGATLGAVWGAVAGHMPPPRHLYVAEIRVLLVLVGGLFANFFTLSVGWGGAGTIAILVCNATASKIWSKQGWVQSSNPATTAYRVMWAALEPMVFAYTGTFFVINKETGRTLMYGLAILPICLLVRLMIAASVCWKMSLKERLFVCCTWIPKSIVEAVLAPLAITTLMSNMSPHHKHELAHAEDLLRLLVQAILITTPLGFLLTKYCGSWLLRDTAKDCENSRRGSNQGSAHSS